MAAIVIESAGSTVANASRTATRLVRTAAIEYASSNADDNIYALLPWSVAADIPMEASAGYNDKGPLDNRSPLIVAVGPVMPCVYFEVASEAENVGVEELMDYFIDRFRWEVEHKYSKSDFDYYTEAERELLPLGRIPGIASTPFIVMEAVRSARKRKYLYVFKLQCGNAATMRIFLRYLARGFFGNIFFDVYWTMTDVAVGKPIQSTTKSSSSSSSTGGSGGSRMQGPIELDIVRMCHNAFLGNFVNDEVVAVRLTYGNAPFPCTSYRFPLMPMRPNTAPYPTLPDAAKFLVLSAQMTKPARGQQPQLSANNNEKLKSLQHKKGRNAFDNDCIKTDIITGADGRQMISPRAAKVCKRVDEMFRAEQQRKETTTAAVASGSNTTSNSGR